MYCPVFKTRKIVGLETLEAVIPIFGIDLQALPLDKYQFVTQVFFVNSVSLNEGAIM
jgi:hypothetical protein